MFSVKHSVILIALVAFSLALKCYTGYTKNKDKTKETVDCPTAGYCYKKTEKSGKDDIHTYGCAWTQDCPKLGCTTVNKITKCCCNRDLCNGSTPLLLIISFAPFIVVRFIFY
ncbi:unnamed protein product [Cylicocyclus nassatus]|uniref:Activin types I and II receptor domain-containing protein n=1 Tax=Cylicocyclus nassatus TaxID=53992 RepID=A0AA36GTM6_CYLNA|nr:unnamed protein product [Cylicocyclus nassatus]